MLVTKAFERSDKELATRRWLAANGYSTDFNSPGREHVDKAWVKEQRSLYKTLILAGLYGESIKNLSKKAGVSEKIGNEIWSSFMGSMPKVKEYEHESVEYANRTGYVKTILGEKIPIPEGRVSTTATNLRTQGFTAIVLAAFFYNCIERGMNLGIDVTSKMVIHDSQTIEFPIRNLFHMDLICRKYFRQACKKYFWADYKFDWDLLFDLMKHVPYSFNMDSRVATFRLWSEKADYLLDHLSTSYKFKVLERKEFMEPAGDGLKVLLGKAKSKYHMIMENERFRQLRQTDLKIQLTEPLKDIDWYDEPLEDTFVEHVKTIKSLSAPIIAENMEKKQKQIKEKSKKPEIERYIQTDLFGLFN